MDHAHATGHGREGGAEAHRRGAAGDIQDHVLWGVSQTLELGEQVFEAFEGVTDLHRRVDDPVAEPGRARAPRTS